MHILSRISILALLLSCSATLNAQNWLFKVGGGLASHYKDSKAVGAYQFGVLYEHVIDEHWALTPGLAFSGKGWKDPDVGVPITDDGGNIVLDDEGKPLMGVMSRKASAMYVEIPILANYFVPVGSTRLRFSAGPYLAVGVAGKRETKGDTSRDKGEKLFYEDKTFLLPGAQRFDVGAQIGAAYEFPNGLTLGAEAQFGFLKTQAPSARNVAGQIVLCYKLNR